jgi:hypothetical protein
VNAIEIVSKAKAMGVRLILNGDGVKLRGPAEAIAAIKPELAAHKPEIIEHLRAAASDAENVPDDCIGALRDPDGGLYLPWGPYVDPDQVKAMQRELFDVVDELAKLEHWPDSDYDHVVTCIERQPISTLRPDLAYFTERLRVAQAEKATREATSRRAWRFDR